MLLEHIIEQERGLIGSWIALILYALTSAMTKTGILSPVLKVINQPTNENASMADTLHIPNWILVILITIITLILVTKTLKNLK